jgi:hypothetical protein
MGHAPHDTDEAEANNRLQVERMHVGGGVADDNLPVPRQPTP